MPKTLTAREHRKKAVKYYFDGDRTIREARLAMKLNPNYVRLHRIIGCVYLSTEPVVVKRPSKNFANWYGKIRVALKVTNISAVL